MLAHNIFREGRVCWEFGRLHSVSVNSLLNRGEKDGVIMGRFLLKATAD